MHYLGEAISLTVAVLLGFTVIAAERNRETGAMAVTSVNNVDSKVALTVNVYDFLLNPACIEG